jgi:hypothetical protein
LHLHHRVGGVTEQVENDLLELNTIAGDGRQIAGELRLKNHSVPAEGHSRKPQ